MSRAQKYITQLGDYGHVLRFYFTEPDGSAYAIPAEATVTFEAYVDGGSTLTINDAENVTIEDGRLSCYYTTQSGDISTAGKYWCRVKVNNITSHEAEWTVRAEYPSGE